MVNHVVIFDGTGQTNHGKILSHPARIAFSLEMRQKAIQRLYYEVHMSGIGTFDTAENARRASVFRRAWKLGGQATGSSLLEKTALQIVKVSKTYAENDQITALEYSRGGVSAMLFCRFIRVAGLPDKNSTVSDVERILGELIGNGGRSNKRYKDMKDSSTYKNILVDRLILLDPVSSSVKIDEMQITFRTSDARSIACFIAADERRALFRHMEFQDEAETEDERNEEDGTHPDTISFIKIVFAGDHATIGGSARGNEGIHMIPLRHLIRVIRSSPGPELLWRCGVLEDISFGTDSPVAQGEIEISEYLQSPDHGPDKERDKIDAVAPFLPKQTVGWRILGLLAWPGVSGRRDLQHTPIHWTLDYREDNIPDYAPVAQLGERGARCSAREVALRAEITSLEEHLGQDEDPKKFVKNHIKLLHDYNEAKDAAQLAVYKETTIKQLHEAYGLSPDD
ncbi:hypothetical protein ACEPAI_5850 [Sanghuangporus weigelae]